MKFNLKNIWVLMLNALIGVGSYVLGKCGITRTCDYYADLNRFTFSLFDPILVFTIVLIPLTLFLICVKDSAFKQWLKFASWWIPLSIVLIALMQTDGHAMMPLYPEATKENMALLMAGLFTILSVRMILRANRAQKKS